MKKKIRLKVQVAAKRDGNRSNQFMDVLGKRQFASRLNEDRFRVCSWRYGLNPASVKQQPPGVALFDTSGFRGSGNYVVGNHDLFPDGESFLMLRAVGDSPPPAEIRVILNFLEELERLLPMATGEQ